jgi:pSer/pThr/pTyr-binding forkhead associated (FHA) protein
MRWGRNGQLAELATLWLGPVLALNTYMRVSIEWANEQQTVELADGTVTIGGGPNDDIRVEGVPHGVLSVRIEGERATVTAKRALRIGQSLFPPRVSRLWLPGETLWLPNDTKLVRPFDESREKARAAVATAMVAQQLLKDDVLDAPSRAAQLVCVAGHDSGKRFTIAYLDNCIGRAQEADVRVRDMSASRTHARLYREGSRYLLADLNGANGTYVNGQRIQSARVLKTGDLIEVGTTMLRFEEGSLPPEDRTVVEPAAKPNQPAVVVSKPLPSAESPASVEVDLGSIQERLAEQEPPVEETAKGLDPRRTSRWEWGMVAVGSALFVGGVTATLLAVCSG